MNMKKWLALSLALCLALSLAACGKESPVYVQSVQALTGLGGIAPGDRFTGMVVSENVSEIEKDADKTIKELLVKEGQDVKAGETLFSYDTEELQLTLDKQLLELEQLKATVENCQAQIKQLEKERKSAGASAKLQYTIQIQTTQVDQKEAELNIKTKEKEIEKSENLLANAAVVSPVDGRVQSINENGTDDRGNPLPYISIQQVGAYRVKGVLGELQRGGIQAGNRMKILSRTDPDALWGGTVTLVDYESPIKDDNPYMMSGNSDEMTSSSKYPFYVELDTTEGLILGQHVYMELDSGEGGAAMELSAAFVVVEEDGSAYVWAEKNGKLEKRTVTLGEMNEMMGTYPILEGLTLEDYIAFPDEQVCRPGAPTTHEMILETDGDSPEGGEMMPEGGEILPEDGVMMPEGGEILPEDGVMMPEGGEILPEDGVMVPEGGEVLPEDGTVLPEGGDVAPAEPDTEAPEAGGEPADGDALTPKDGSTMGPVETKEAVG